MVKKSNDRKVMQVSPKFHTKLKELRLSILKQGREVSMRELTDLMVQVDAFEDIESKILNQYCGGFIKFDKRK